MTAQVWLNPLTSLSHGEVMIDYVINDCCPNFIRASYMNATQGPLYFYYGLFLALFCGNLSSPCKHQALQFYSVLVDDGWG